MFAIGIDLGGTNIKAALVEKERGILEKLSIPTEAGKGKEHVFARIKMAVDKLGEGHDVALKGIGIGSPGMVSMDRSTVKNPPNFKGWIAVDLAGEIKKKTGLPCIVENDGNIAALGSSRFGIGKDFDSLIMITLGTGVGGGIIFNREIFRGTTGAAGELGHIIIDYKGPFSNSNTRGGIEAYLGQRFLSRSAVELIRLHPDNPLYSRFHEHPESLEPVDIYTAAESGNDLAADILRNAGEKLGYAIVNYVHTLDIRKIVVSGGVAKAGRWILDSSYETALANLMPPYHAEFEILYEPPENEVALYGASFLALEKL